MEKEFEKFMKGFKRFGRSFNCSVLAYDRTIQDEFQTALDTGSIQCNRIRTLFVGEKGVGKTSLLEMLTGGCCDPNAEVASTEGIEITICQTSDENPNWDKVDFNEPIPADDPAMCAGWNICQNDTNVKGLFKTTPHPLNTGSRTRARQFNRARDDQKEIERGDFKDPKTLIRTSFYFLKINLILFLLVTFGMSFGFGPFMWCVVLGYYILIGDFNSAYRFGAGSALTAVLVDDLSRDQQKLDILPEVWHVQFLSPVLVFCIKAILICLLITLWGFLCGIGCRTGLGIAFCLMVRIPAISNPKSTQWEAALALCFGHLLGIFTLRAFMLIVSSKRLQRKEYRLFIALIVTLISIALIQLVTSKILLNVLLGSCMGCCVAWGAFKGRELIAAKHINFSYFTKKTAGFVLALLSGQLLGWSLLSTNATLFEIVSSSLSTLGFIYYDFSVYLKVKRLESQNLPIGMIRNLLMASFRGSNPIGLKIHLWDFAGDALYSDMQQFFFPSRAVYLLVFNLEDAYNNEERQMKALRKWMYSIKSRASSNETVIFLVGTHRDSILKNDPFINNFADYLRIELYESFCGILAVKPNDKILYVVENSKLMDEDGQHLRRAILKRVEKIPYLKEEFPISYLKILNQIHKLSQEKETIFLKTSSVWPKAEEEGIDMQNFLKMLDFFHSTGELIFLSHDDSLEKYIILEPQLFLDIMKSTLKVPRLSERDQKAEEWLRMEKYGETTVNFLEDIIRNEIEDVKLVPLVVAFLTSQNLIIPVNDPDGIEIDHYVIPNLLPKSESPMKVTSASLWEDDPDEREYYIDFGYVPADAIFHRLLAKCSRGDPSERLRYNQGRFKFHGSVFYLLQLVYLPSGQCLIRIVVQNNDTETKSDVGILKWLTGLFKDIRKKDFMNLKYVFGPACQTCSVNGIQLLEVCSGDKPFPATNQFPITTFLDKRYHEVSLAPQLSVTCGKRRRVSSTSSTSGERK